MAGNAKHEGMSVARTVVAIMCVSRQRHELSNVQIARLTGLPVSTAHRLLGELVVGGMLERTPDRHYRVGKSFRAIANGSRSAERCSGRIINPTGTG
jgi:DNA-binding IclR family transcriptional regulator